MKTTIVVPRRELQDTVTVMRNLMGAVAVYTSRDVNCASMDSIIEVLHVQKKEQVTVDRESLSDMLVVLRKLMRVVSEETARPMTCSDAQSLEILLDVTA